MSIKKIVISFDETFHEIEGKPLYNNKYKKVMSFHNGIAPVENIEGSFFIDIHNNRLFNKIFKKAYGFYEGLASVADDKGWYCIDLTGNKVFNNRFAWCGNFQEGRCVVKDFDNNYFHIDRLGNQVYNEKYTYAGDYKYGIAVIMNKKGFFTHIDLNGNFIHNQWFEELDVFHKGTAIAKDEKGYFHINKLGYELYQERYIKLEPFYNGRALATNKHNEKIILSENDYSSVTLSSVRINKNKIIDKSFDFFEYRILYAILKLDVLNTLSKGRKLKLPIVSVNLIKKWLIYNKIINEDLTLTALGSIIENELKPIILYWQGLPFEVSTKIVYTLKKGKESFSKLYDKHFFNYIESKPNLQQQVINLFDYYTVDYNNIIKNLPFENKVVCDIGGGSGALLNSIKKIFFNSKTILADKFNNQTQHKFIKIDFFKSFKINADIFIMSRVLHDWNDKKALKILTNVSKNMKKDTKLYIFETILSDDKGIILSFHLLNFVGGRERTIKEFEYLCKKSNLVIKEIYYQNNLISIIEIQKRDST